MNEIREMRDSERVTRDPSDLISERGESDPQFCFRFECVHNSENIQYISYVGITDESALNLARLYSI